MAQVPFNFRSLAGDKAQEDNKGKGGIVVVVVLICLLLTVWLICCGRR